MRHSNVLFTLKKHRVLTRKSDCASYAQVGFFTTIAFSRDRMCCRYKPEERQKCSHFHEMCLFLHPTHKSMHLVEKVMKIMGVGVQFENFKDHLMGTFLAVVQGSAGEMNPFQTESGIEMAQMPEAAAFHDPIMMAEEVKSYQEEDSSMQGVGFSSLLKSRKHRFAAGNGKLAFAAGAIAGSIERDLQVDLCQRQWPETCGKGKHGLYNQNRQSISYQWKVT